MHTVNFCTCSMVVLRVYGLYVQMGLMIRFRVSHRVCICLWFGVYGQD